MAKIDFRMERRFIALSENAKVRNAVKHIRKAVNDDMIFYAYVVDELGILKGVLPLRTLLLSNENKKMKEVMIRKITSVHHKMTDEEISEVFMRTKFLALPVVDDKGKLLGTITLKHAVDIINKENIEDFLKTQGADIGVYDKSIWTRIKVKLPWLITTVISGIVCGAIVWKFEPALEKILALAFFIPLITAMGESVAGQASAIVIEGLLLGKIKEKDIFSVLARQMVEGLLMSLVIGGLVWGISYFWLKDVAVAHIIGSTIVVTVIIATFNGTLGPVILKKMGIDPVASTNPLVFALTDILVLIYYFSFALIMIKYFL